MKTIRRERYKKSRI